MFSSLFSKFSNHSNPNPYLHASNFLLLTNTCMHFFLIILHALLLQLPTTTGVFFGQKVDSLQCYQPITFISGYSLASVCLFCSHEMKSNDDHATRQTTWVRNPWCKVAAAYKTIVHYCGLAINYSVNYGLPFSLNDNS